MAVAGRWMLKEAGAAAPLSNCLKCSVRLRGVSPCVASPAPHPETRGTLACALRIDILVECVGCWWCILLYEKQSVSSCLIQSPHSEPGPSVVCASGGGEVVTKPLLGNYPISRLENRLISTRPRPASCFIYRSSHTTWRDDM